MRRAMADQSDQVLLPSAPASSAADAQEGVTTVDIGVCKPTQWVTGIPEDQCVQHIAAVYPPTAPSVSRCRRSRQMSSAGLRYSISRPPPLQRLVITQWLQCWEQAQLVVTHCREVVELMRLHAGLSRVAERAVGLRLTPNLDRSVATTSF